MGKIFLCCLDPRKVKIDISTMNFDNASKNNGYIDDYYFVSIKISSGKKYKGKPSSQSKIWSWSIVSHSDVWSLRKMKDTGQLWKNPEVEYQI